MNSIYFFVSFSVNALLIVERLKMKVGLIAYQMMSEYFSLLEHASMTVKDRLADLRQTMIKLLTNLDGGIEYLLHLKIDLSPVEQLFRRVYAFYQKLRQRYMMDGNGSFSEFAQTVRNEVADFTGKLVAYLRNVQAVQDGISLYWRLVSWLEHVKFFENAQDTGVRLQRFVISLVEISIK